MPPDSGAPSSPTDTAVTAEVLRPSPATLPADPGTPTSEELRTTRADVYLVIGLGLSSIVFAVLYTATGFWPFEHPLWVACLISVLITVPLLFRRRCPSLMAWIQCGVCALGTVLVILEPAMSQVILFMGLYSIGAWQRNRRAAFWSRVFLNIAMLVLVVWAMHDQRESMGELTVLQYMASAGVSFLVSIAFLGGAWVFGDRAWRQRQLFNELRRANDEAAEQERLIARQALDLERVRIARELHDGVAHHVAGVGIHAAAARRSLEKNPDKARESLRTIEESARQTVDELRGLVYTLRDTSSTDIDQEAHTAGDVEAHRNPCLGDLPELIASAQTAERRIELHSIGDPRSLTPITETTIYRVVQESLTNCRRYAGIHAEVDVRLRYGSGSVEVEISDSVSRATGHQTSKGAGVGIVGMRERVTALGGELVAGPKSRGGWLVSARIPYSRSTTGTTENQGSAAEPTASNPDTALGRGSTSEHPAPSDRPTAKAQS